MSDGIRRVDLMANIARLARGPVEAPSAQIRMCLDTRRQTVASAFSRAGMTRVTVCSLPLGHAGPHR